MVDAAAYEQKYDELFPQLHERGRRLIAASDAKLLGHGGIEIVHKTSGLSRTTIASGINELTHGDVLPPHLCRKKGAGRKKSTDKDKTLFNDLLELVTPTTAGDPMSPLLWTAKSTRHISSTLNAEYHVVSHMTVSTLLKEAGYSLQSNVKSKEGTMKYEDRDHQFSYINEQAKVYLTSGDPVISVDTKKKELIGNYKNQGREWSLKGTPLEVNMHDFPDPDMGKAIPYGVYDIAQNNGYVTVGITHDTAEFAVSSIKNWWNHLGRKRYPRSRKLLITPDAGGSNGYRVRLWKKEIQKFADNTGLEVTVCHFPRGTSKWNKIEHKLFSFISCNWRGRPLTSYEVIVNLIAATTTQTGLKVYALLDSKKYRLKKEVSDRMMKQININPHEWHGDLNYTIKPGSK